MQMKLAPWALLAVAAMWGISFVWMKDILDQQDVYSFLTSRFLVAAAAMIILKPKVLKAFNKELIFKGLIVGMALGSGYIFQTLHRFICRLHSPARINLLKRALNVGNVGLCIPCCCWTRHSLLEGLEHWSR